MKRRCASVMGLTAALLVANMVYAQASLVNFGATVDEAKANENPRMILFHRESGDVKDPTTHVIFAVKDMAATVAAIRAAGGTMAGDPRPFGNSGTILGFAADPAGNRIELIQRPSAEGARQQ